MPDNLTNVYFLFAESLGLVKIGRAVDIDKRIATFSTFSPVPLRLVKSDIGVPARAETAYHDRFGEYRAHGEWFVVRGELATFLGLSSTDMTGLAIRLLDSGTAVRDTGVLTDVMAWHVKGANLALDALRERVGI